MKILTVVGARPQFIKASVVSRALGEWPDVCEVLVHTGQHHDSNMSDVFFDELEIRKPDHDLGIVASQHGEMSGRMMIALEKVVQQEKPDIVLVYGDTNSTLAGALVAAKLFIPVAHVEAGLRSFNYKMPEEINRVVTDVVAELLFAPTDGAAKYLQAQPNLRGTVIQSGDVMYDAALYYGEKAKRHGTVLAKHGIEEGRYILATVHRQENTDDQRRLRNIVKALDQINNTVPVVFPLHPRTRKRIEEFGIGELLDGLKVLDPLGYLEMIELEQASSLVVTDSGGVQKEAYFHRVPCVTLRGETEWMELIELGWNRLLDPELDNLSSEIMSALGSSGREGSPYGAGTAGAIIAETLSQYRVGNYT